MRHRRTYDQEVNVALSLNSFQLSRFNSPPTASIHLTDNDGCAVIVQIKLEGKTIEEFSLEEITDLALAAAKHLTSQV